MPTFEHPSFLTPGKIRITSDGTTPGTMIEVTLTLIGVRLDIVADHEKAA